jgi:hypothetical protein
VLSPTLLTARIGKELYHPFIALVGVLLTRQYTVRMSGRNSKEDVDASGSSAHLYHRNDDFPHKPRRLTFRKKSADFKVTVAYDAAAAALLPPGEDLTIAEYTVKIPAGTPPAVRLVVATFPRFSFLSSEGFVILARLCILYRMFA